MLRNTLLFWIALSLLMNCANQKEEEAVLKQAHEIHMEAIKLNEEVQPKLKELVQLKSKVERQEEESSQEVENFINQVEQLEKSYQYWEANHVEVSGFEHEGHDHNHSHHDHDHGPILEVSATDMLLLQQEFKDSLSVISKRLENIRVPEYLSLQF